MSADPEDFTDDLIGPDDPVGPPTPAGLMNAIFDYLEGTDPGEIAPGPDDPARLGDAVEAAAALVLAEVRRIGGSCG